jgi:DoxX-like family
MKELMMNLTLWIIAGLLAVAYLAGGAAKLIVPKEKWATFRGGGWAEDFSAGTFKAIGALEVLAAVGLVLPAALDIAPVLVPLAALGLVSIMAGAVITRLRRREVKIMVADLAYLALAGFVAWGRFGPESFTG